MSGLLDLVSQQLSGVMVKELSNQIGADTGSTQSAVAAALPMLVGGLARNANQSPEGAQSLAKALDNDHDGSLLDGLAGMLGGGASGSSGGGGGLMGMAGSLLGGSSGSSSSGGGGLGSLLGAAGGLLGGGAPQSRAADGNGILGHVLGNRRGAVESGVAQASGLDSSQISKLLPMLAPVVMSALGRVKKQENLDAGGLASMLNQERARVERDTPGMEEGGLLSFLDMDNDGDVSDDVAKIGSFLSNSGILGNLLGGK